MEEVRLDLGEDEVGVTVGTIAFQRERRGQRYWDGTWQWRGSWLR